ncbi:LLM class flavin-dependent oxidoreductase [Siccirubricoccus sp. KC 17139]|uniref:LLM class flavin-dependent oxidoreductase n=1 Tax=Siccirubricoccus soli TaxID=2899147 RepID=A0ABT1D0X3_9PROT|nr:LLM class flavin-dependent oxidoreductase [Siccirubricoccus soli]MCO6414914.1 LLM class flavin-dependent oxidoreductase [Siccirubricoccus soli]MCP2681044.1 LLM class flavin-dependent oxidoreductase [Siccirubricoccus soli]
MRQMHLIGFLQAQNCTIFASSWRHPESRVDFLTADHFQEIARILEAGKFDLGFFDDRLSMPDRYGSDHVHTIENGIRCVKMDPVVVLTMMGAVTKHLGLGSTASTTYHEPFHIARMFQTLDLMSGGRAAWNIVTSVNDGEAANMGRDETMEHDRRYDRADEFVEVVLGHWDSWEDDALILDKATGRFGDGSKVHRLDYKGRYLKSRGPFTVPRSRQGRPVLIQAGSSGRGKRFSARWAELVFVAYHDVEAGKRDYAAFKRMVAEEGRDPDQVKVATLCNPICAATKAEAEDRAALIAKLPLEIDSLSLLSEALNFDFASKGMDDPFTDEEMASIQGMHAMRDRVVQATGKKNPTVRDFIQATGRGRPRMDMVGGPKEIADKLEEWFTSGACDGFVIAATIMPGSYADFVKYVVPELQRRGLHRKEYNGTTLRDHLGLPRSVPGDWRAKTLAAE